MENKKITICIYCKEALKRVNDFLNEVAELSALSLYDHNIHAGPKDLSPHKHQLYQEKH